MFWDNYVALCEKNNSTPTRVAIELGIGSSAPVKWRRGSKPQAVTAKKIADYFGITVAELMSDEKKPTVALDDGLTSEERDVIEFYRNAPPATRAAMLLFLRSLEADTPIRDGDAKEK